MHWFCFTTLCDWSRKHAPPSQPIRCKSKTNRDLVTRVFPRLRPVTCIYFVFSLAPSEIFLCSDWPLGLLWFWFYDTRSKSALPSQDSGSLVLGYLDPIRGTPLPSKTNTCCQSQLVSILERIDCIITREDQDKKLNHPCRSYSVVNPTQVISRSRPILEIPEGSKNSQSCVANCSPVQPMRRLFILDENIQPMREVHVTLILFPGDQIP